MYDINMTYIMLCFMSKQGRQHEISNTILTDNRNNIWVSICNIGLLDNNLNKKEIEIKQIDKDA